ncbi:MAG: copper transporter [Pseudonocardiales bacterium]|nr:copper transporter [Pseudonocardiales bacterium]
MISLRYHAVSMAAVFLALAVGVVLGASGVSDRLLGAVTAKADDLTGQVQQLAAQRDALAAAQRAGDEFARRVGPAAVRGVLQGRSVAIVSAGADVPTHDGLVALIKDAGGTVSGTVTLTPAVIDPARADQLRQLTGTLLPAGAQLPASSDTGSLFGGLLGGFLTGPGGKAPVTGPQAAAVLTGLTTAGFTVAGNPPASANLVLVLTGGSLTGVDAGDGAAVVMRMAAQLDAAGGGAVLAGATGADDPTGAVGVARADPTVTAALSTVDDVQAGAGQVSTVLALREQADGHAGRYGTATSAADGASPRT